MPIYYSKLFGICMFTYMLAVFVCVSEGYGISRRQASCSAHDSSQTGSTPDIENIFKGRCAEFQNLLITPETCPGKRVDCDDAWSKFSGAFIGKDPCNVSSNAYDDFLMAVPIVFPPDKSLFWSGTNTLSHEYTAVNEIYYTLEQSMLGYLTNGLTWCSSMGSSTLKTDGPCPSWNSESCPNTADGVYWAAASTMLAEQTRGVATVFLNGSTPWPSFNTDSFFAKYELPNMDPEKVTKIQIVVAHNVDGPVNERCGTKSIKVLEDLIDELGYPVACEDSPESVRLLQCVANADHESCDLEDDPGAANHIYLSKTLILVIISVMVMNLVF